MMSTRKANSVFQKKPIYTLLAFGVAMAGFPNALAQSTYRESQDARTVTCSSDDGQRTYCDADTRGGVRLTRQLSGSACQQGSTWGSDSRGIWVARAAGQNSAFPACLRRGITCRQTRARSPARRTMAVVCTALSTREGMCGCSAKPGAHRAGKAPRGAMTLGECG